MFILESSLTGISCMAVVTPRLKLVFHSTKLTSVRYLSLGSMVPASLALALAPIPIFFNLNSTYHVSKLLFILYCCSRDHAKDRVAF